MCLCFTFIREGLRGVEQRLVLHGVLVHNWHVQLRKGDVTYYDTLDSCRLHFLPPPVNLSNTPTTTKELKVWLNNVSTTDPVGPRPMLLHIAPIQLPLCVCASREWPPTLHLLFIERVHITERALQRWLLATKKMKCKDVKCGFNFPPQPFEWYWRPERKMMSNH